MDDADLPSWRKRFEESLARLRAERMGPPDYGGLDEYLQLFPLELDDRWGPEMDDLHRVALRTAVKRQVAFISNDLEMAAMICQSPPERAVLYALAIIAWDWADGVLLRVKGNASGLIASRFVMVEIEPQAQLGVDRVDFLITMKIRPLTGASKRSQLVVECDGHDWHERTGEQAKKDRTRDRRLQALDLAVFRYTGSDAWEHVFGAAKEAIEELAHRMN
jgi:very-short-patch-repair endonuclease